MDRVGTGNIDFRIKLINEKDIRYTPRGNFKYLINLTFIKYQETIFKVVGREDDYVICKDGTRVTRIDFIENGEHIKTRALQKKIVCMLFAKLSEKSAKAIWT